MNCSVCGEEMTAPWATMCRFGSDVVDKWCRPCAWRLVKTALIGSILVNDDAEADDLLRFLRGQKQDS